MKFLWGSFEIDRRGATITVSAHKFCHVCRIEIAPGHEHTGVGGVLYCPLCWKNASTIAGVPPPPKRRPAAAPNMVAMPPDQVGKKYNCGICRNQIPFSDVNFFDGEILCTPCFENARAGEHAPLAQCQNCECNALKSMMVIFDGKRLCPECFNDARIGKNQEFQLRRQHLSASRVTLKHDPPKTQGRFAWIVTILSALVIATVVVIVVYSVHKGVTDSVKPVTFALQLSDGRNIDLPRPEALDKLAADKGSCVIRGGVKLSREESIQYVQSQQ